MDKASKKRLKAQVREHQREAAMAALPLPVTELAAMFDMLDVELPLQGCDHSRRITKAWLTGRGHDVEAVFAWLDTQGGYCDCEVLANVEEKVDEAKKASQRTPH
ncbi:MAG: DUF2695 domain-containing protein [Myxococcales bacterium]|nr:DUF2695 domain-containing protein [Myxococcales bacterium]